VIVARLTSALALALTFGVTTAQSSDGNATPSPADSVKVEQIRAQLYYRDRGEFSHDVLADSTFRFWNAIIGGGSSRGRVSAALVTVVLGAPGGEYRRADTLSVTATVRGQVVLSGSRVVGATYRGRIYETFLIAGVGCDSVRIDARVVSGGRSQTKRATLPFACGE
jgi:hypothetical protein